MPAEVYADGPEDLQRLLRYLPEHEALPVVHLNRRLNLLDPAGEATVHAFASRFAGRVHGLVLHDRAEMSAAMPAVVAVLRRLGGPTRGSARRPLILLEYAAGLDPGWYLDLAERLADVERASCCIDIGHLGIRESRRELGRHCPDLGGHPLTAQDPRLPAVVHQVQEATRAALPHVLDLVAGLGRVGKPAHLHLHDGHLLVPGLADHFSFLTRIPVPFEVAGRRSVDPLYGPTGLAAVLRCGQDAFPAGMLSATLEIHQVDGRLPLPAAEVAGLFGHWRDLTNAERMNYLLSVLADNHLLATLALEQAVESDPA